MKLSKIYGSAIKSLIVSLLFTALMVLLCAVLITYTDFQDKWTGIISLAVSGICCFYMGIKVSRSTEKNGMIWGLISAVIYIISVFLIISLIAEKTWSLESYAFGIVISLIFGISGGILGVNVKK